MSCPCDQLVFPPALVIPAGLDALPRQIATFPEFREALLAAIPSEAALLQWRARSGDDFGVLLLEMWAYVCDSISFYDEVIADESYVRTASLRPSLRKLVALLGYVPAPAIGASVDLAVLASGRLPVIVPAGTQFRSGAFPGGTPQVFELTNDSRVHPFLNSWMVERTRSATIGAAPYAAAQTGFLVDPKSNRLKAGQVVMVEDLADATSARARVVQSVADTLGNDGARYQTAMLDESVPISSDTPVASVQVSSPTQAGTLWQHPVGTSASGLISRPASSVIVFDSVHRDIQLNDRIVLDKAGDKRWFKVIAMEEVSAAMPSSGSATVTDSGGTVTANVAINARTTLTAIELDATYNDTSRREPGTTDWTAADARNVKVRFGFVPAATVTAQMSLTLAPTDPMVLTPPVEMPRDGKVPSVFLLQDADTNGAEVSGSIDFTSGVLTAVPQLSQPLAAPVQAYGNVVSATRGESVSAEVLGDGDASTASQTFKLKKSPLTYGPGVATPVSSLRVYVDGLLWSEVASFYGLASDAQVYIVRQDDDGESWVSFGDGLRGSRLTTGAGNVVAYYRFGAGAASPPAGSIQQLAKAVKAISSIRNPVAAGGGSDAESADSLQTSAPRSALLLGRAISLDDMEAAALTVGGVRAARCVWQWSAQRQRPVVEVWYIGATSIAGNVLQKLRGLSDSVTPIKVDTAVSLPTVLSLSIEIDPRRLEDDVLSAVRTALTNPTSGMLAPENIGIGAALFESRIFAAVLAVPGALAVQGLMLNGSSFPGYGVDPQTGNYFDLEAGTLLLNGKAS